MGYSRLGDSHQPVEPKGSSRGRRFDFTAAVQTALHDRKGCGQHKNCAEDYESRRWTLWTGYRATSRIPTTAAERVARPCPVQGAFVWPSAATLEARRRNRILHGRTALVLDGDLEQIPGIKLMINQFRVRTI